MTKEVAKVKEEVRADLAKAKDEMRLELKAFRESLEREMRNERRELKTEWRDLGNSVEHAHAEIVDLRKKLYLEKAKNVKITAENEALRSQLAALETRTTESEKRLVLSE